jgi:cbb3-type cytochrome oxidase subunit 3
MRLSDIMGHADLAFWPVVALVIFGVVFVAIVFRVMSKKRRAEYERASRLPLEENHPPAENGAYS